jgi:hypothetical protein
VRRAVGLALAQAIPGWSDFAGVSPVGQMPAMEGVYRRLVLGASPALARCREGDLRSCWIAMGVTGVADAEAEVRLWYDPDQRRELVEAAYARVRGPTGCIMLGEQAACDEILAARRNTLVPLNPSARAALASVALEIGGDGALARLSDAYAGGADVRERIASAAGVPADQVMAEWHRRVTGSRPERGREARQVRVASLLWILLLLAFSTRSTRWRLG